MLTNLEPIHANYNINLSQLYNYTLFNGPINIKSIACNNHYFPAEFSTSGLSGLIATKKLLSE